MGDPTLAATHIRLLCWGERHVQAIDALNLQAMVCPPVCTAPVDHGVCGAPIWAVEHGGEPIRYVGRPPHNNWQRWAECIPVRSDARSTQ